MHHDLLATDLPDLVEQSSAGTTVISNPPYGKRLQQEDI